MFYQRIRYFLKAAESGSFSKAADQMFISAQALTKQIGLLEDELGGKLFVRSYKGITLTPLGEYAQLKFKKIDQELNGTVEELRQQAGKIGLLLTYIHEEEKWQDYSCQCFEEHDAKVVVSLLHPWAIYDNIEVKDMENETFLKLRTSNENYLPKPGERFYDKIPCKNIQEVKTSGHFWHFYSRAKALLFFQKCSPTQSVPE